MGDTRARDGENTHSESQNKERQQTDSLARVIKSGRRSDFTDWLKGAEINRDRNLRLQYLAGMGLDNNGSFYIYYEMIKRFHYPDNLFIVSAEKKTALRKMLGLTK